MVKGIVIDEFKCDGCGLCVSACHEGALAIVNGKARMVRADFCDGLGDCLPVCPQGAISFIESCGCETPQVIMPGSPPAPPRACYVPFGPGSSELRQWPVKLKLVHANSPFFKNADILLAADCSAFAYSLMHEDLIRKRAVAICCPKFDTGIGEKLADILSNNDTKTLTVVRMTVPCCSLEREARDAVEMSGKDIPLRIVTIDQRGNVTENENKTVPVR